jgi:hypothetical protein
MVKQTRVNTLDWYMMNKQQPRFALTALIAVFFCMVVPSHARAESYAVVQAISEPDARGRWKPVTESAAAVRLDGEARTPLTVGMALELGDRIVTEEVRVTVGFGASNVIGNARQETLTVAPGGDITIKERSILQQMGEVYYQVRDVFSVDYGTVQTAVEGTEFSISGVEGPVNVAVTDGVVRVSNAGTAVRVKKGQSVLVDPVGAPPSPTKMPGSVMRAVQQGAWSLGRPKLQVGMIGSGGLMGSEVGGELRTFAAVRLLPMINLVGEGGFGLTPGSSLSSSGLGLEVVLGGLSVGGSLQTKVEQQDYACGGHRTTLHIGGHAHGRFTMSITRRFFVAATGRIGGDGDGVSATGGFGAGVSL